jgi:hypothetical protein
MGSDMTTMQVGVLGRYHDACMVLSFCHTNPAITVALSLLVYTFHVRHEPRFGTTASHPTEAQLQRGWPLGGRPWPDLDII